MRSAAEIRARIEHLETEKAAFICPLDIQWARRSDCKFYQAEREALYWALGERAPSFTPYYLFDAFRAVVA